MIGRADRPVKSVIFANFDSLGYFLIQSPRTFISADTRLSKSIFAAILTALAALFLDIIPPPIFELFRVL